jgi:hypothetical protein
VVARWWRRGGGVSQAEPGTSAKGHLAVGVFCIYKCQLAPQLDRISSASTINDISLSAARNTMLDKVEIPALALTVQQWLKNALFRAPIFLNDTRNASRTY